MPIPSFARSGTAAAAFTASGWLPAEMTTDLLPSSQARFMGMFAGPVHPMLARFRDRLTDWHRQAGGGSLWISPFPP